MLIFKLGLWYLIYYPKQQLYENIFLGRSQEQIYSKLCSGGNYNCIAVGIIVKNIFQSVEYKVCKGPKYIFGKITKTNILQALYWW